MTDRCRRSHGRRLALLLLSVSLTTVARAQAQSAFTYKVSNLRAGPSTEFPVVIRLGPNTPVQVVGCVDDWTWCDVVVPPDRGWIYAGNIAFMFQGNPVIVRWAGPTLGLPVITFSLGAYWDLYYRTRPWYARRSYWIGRPPPPRWPYPSTRPPSIQVPPPRPNPPPRPRPPAARPTPRPPAPPTSPPRRPPRPVGRPTPRA